MGVNKTNVAKETNGNLASLVAKDYATQTTLATRLSESDFDTKTGSLTETAPATDTASSGLNGRLQRIAQRLTSLISLLPTALGTNGGLKIEGVASGTAVPILASSLPLPSGASTSAKQPALGTAGTPSSDVITIQGSSGMRAVVIDGTATTQPVSIAAPTTIYHAKKTVTTAGTRVALASSQAVRSVCIKALQTNTGYIYVGDTSTSSTTGFQLLAGDTISLDIANLNTVYIDSSVSGEGVTYISSN
jgi:hypothetical protein